MKRLFEDVLVGDRTRMLKDNCVSIKQHSYMRSFTHEELAEMRDQLTEQVLHRAAIEAEYAAVREQHKGRLKPVVQEIVELCQGLRDKARSVNEQCYVLADHATGMAQYVNDEGEIVFERPLDVSERQENLPGVIKMPAQAKGA
ncbi:MAG: hypothetical protein NTV22_11445 [bacterium]|jgi:hypothetical protein|nr:hypothetical protein [bacterium]